MTSQTQPEVIKRNELTNPARELSVTDFEIRTQNIVNQAQLSDESTAIINFEINFGIIIQVNSNQSDNDTGFYDVYNDITSTYAESIINRDEYTTSPLFFTSNNYFVVS